MTSTSVTQARHPVPGTRESHIVKMRAAADKHLDDYTPQERQAWAVRTVDAYVARGILEIREEML